MMPEITMLLFFQHKISYYLQYNPKDTYILISRTCEYVILHERENESCRWN